MITKNNPPLADAWGTAWDDEIRQFRDERIAAERKISEGRQELDALRPRMISLMKKARNEGWNMALSNILYGRDYQKGQVGWIAYD